MKCVSVYVKGVEAGVLAKFRHGGYEFRYTRQYRESRATARGDALWFVWFTVLFAFFAVCLTAEAIPFVPWIATTQKLRICSFAVWAGWVAWRLRKR